MSDTPISDAMRAEGSWNPAWNEAAAFAPEWMEDFVRMGTTPWRRNVLDPKTIEFIAIAVDAACTHLYAPGARRHIAKALELGATAEEIFSVLQTVATLGIHSVALGAPILAEELTKRGMPIPVETKENNHAVPR
jgi:alkylhydroperoxidase/carboxymuconolactone decarboxylase family protein YurZ